MKKYKPFVSIVLILALLLSAGFPMGTLIHAQALSQDDFNWGAYSNWAGSSPSGVQGFKWSFAELWWYGRAQVFSYNADIEYYDEGANTFWVKGKAISGSSESYFGAIAEWGKPLEKGYEYIFRMFVPNVEQAPDFITVNGNIVWKKEGYQFGTPRLIYFTYVPEANNETAYIALVSRAEQDSFRTILPPNHSNLDKGNTNPNEICFVSRRKSFNGERPVYERFTLPEGTEYEKLPKHLTADLLYDQYGGKGVDGYTGYTLPLLPYKTADTKVAERWLPAEKAGSQYYPVYRPEIATFQPGSNSETSFSKWADAVKKAGTKEIALTPVIDSGHLAGGEATGYYTFGHLTAPITGKWDWDQFTSDMAEIATEWLEMVPDGKVWLFDVEGNSAYGPYMGGIRDSRIKEFPGYEAVGNGGSEAWNLAFEFHRDKFFDEIRSKMPEQYRDQVFAMANFDRATFQGAYGYLEGADVIFHKNIHRQSANIVVANSRGAAYSYDKLYGYDFDNWDRQYAHSYTSKEVEHVLKLYFHSGADYIMDEISTFNHDINKLTELGKTWIEFWHYAKTHPEPGEQKVKIGVMRALGDEWAGVGGQTASWETRPWFPTPEINAAFSQNPVPQKWAKAKIAADARGAYKTEDTYFQDYSLLNLLFYDFGNSYRTKSNRLTTGTPFGPVNFLPWNTPADKLNDYEVIMYFGRGAGITEQEASNLAEYVENGGKLVMAAGQLRKEDNTFITGNFLGIGLGEERYDENGLPYTLLSAESGDVLYTISGENNDPAVVKVEYGSGELYLFAGEWLTYWDSEPWIWDNGTDSWSASMAGEIIFPLLEEAKWLNFNTAPDSTMSGEKAFEWLEYTMQKKENTWIIPVFNHGRGNSPSGNGIDYGAWKGTIDIELSKLGLSDQNVSAFKVIYDRYYDPETELPYRLEPVSFSVENGILSMEASVEDFEEYVVGPASTVKVEYFGLENYGSL